MSTFLSRYPIVLLFAICFQVFLAQGLGAGLAMGMTYIPSLSIVSHYFSRRRPIAMGFVAAGSSLGATLHPIMLNNLFNNPKVGFAVGVRASAGLILGLMVIAFSMMRTRLPPKKAVGFLGIWSSATTFVQDWAYVCAVCGYVVVPTATLPSCSIRSTEAYSQLPDSISRSSIYNSMQLLMVSTLPLHSTQ